MKKLILFLLLFPLLAHAGQKTFGDHEIEGDLIVHDTALEEPVLKTDKNNHRVGINKSNPTVALDVIGDITATGTITGTTFTDGTTTITGGNYTGVGNITGLDVDISAGTGDYTSSGTIISGDITILDPTPILVFKDSNSLGAASVGFIEWRDSGGGRAGFLGNNSKNNDDLFWKNEQGGNIGIQTTGSGKVQLFANVDITGTLIVGGTTPDSLFEVDGAVGLAIETVTANTTLNSTHSTVLVQATGNVIIFLPTSASSFNNTDGIGRIYNIKKTDSDTDLVKIDGNGSETIDGATMQIITIQYQSLKIQADGTSWFIL